MTTDRKAVKFFASMSGRVGEAMLSGLHLARAEARAAALGWEVRWDWDEDAGAPDTSWCPICERMAANDRTLPREVSVGHAHEILCAVLVDADGKVLGSLGGIADPDHAYRRLVEAELALEALAEIDGKADADKRAGGYMAL
jgi:hypothetical protein